MTAKQYPYRFDSDGPILVTASALCPPGRAGFVVLRIESAVYASLIMTPADAAQIAANLAQAAKDVSPPTPPPLKSNGRGLPR